MSKYVGKIVTNQASAGYSVAFDGNGDYLTVAANAAFQFGTGNFTIEYWYYPTSFGTNTPIDMGYANAGSYVIQSASDGKPYFYSGSTGIVFTATTGYTLNAWNHLAVSRSGTTLSMFINGARVGSATNSTNFNANFALGIGGSPTHSTAYEVIGYMSNVRLVKGTAVYDPTQTSIRVPTQLLRITNTSILTCNSPAIVDQSSNAFAITTNGNAAVSTFTPFAAYNPAPTTANPLIPAPGVWTLDEALQYTQQGVWPSPAANAIEDVFSTYLYTGNGATQTITNGIDLSGKGGLVWNKLRNNGTAYHYWVDTARGRSSGIGSNSTDAQYISSAGNDLTSFTTTGYTLGPVQNWNASNSNGGTIVSWTFRKQAKFFDIVTWTGDGTNPRTINHNLGSTPGCIIIKCTSSGVADWPVWHRSLPTQGGFLNTVDPFSSGLQYFGSTVTSTTFSLNSANVRTNQAGQTYVAYLFAHDAGGFGPAGADNVISCGSFTYSAGTEVNLGYEPQWLVIKRTDITTAGSWYVVDVTRGWTTDSNASWVTANTTDAEVSAALGIAPTATGFRVPTGYGTGSVYIYIAIRRGPMRPPTTSTSVFSPTIWTGNTPNVLDTRSISGFGKPTDLFIGSDRDTVFNHNLVYDRLRGTDTTGGKLLYTHNTSTEAANANSGSYSFAQMDGITLGNYLINYSGRLDVGWFFGRAPGFFDVVCYTGTGVTDRVVAHNLTIPPQLIITKSRSSADAWAVGTSFGVSSYQWLYLNLTNSALSLNYSAKSRINSQPTATQYVIATDSEINGSGNTYVAYLFATVGGVSKVGSYTGTGTTQQINCGFTNGSRFVMIKRTDSTGAWYVWDSARGIVAGNDPYLLLNSTAAEVTNTDYVDTYSAGFELSSTAPADLNASGGTYIFLAIA